MMSVNSHILLMYILSIHHIFYLLNVDINKTCDITLGIIDAVFTSAY